MTQSTVYRGLVTVNPVSKKLEAHLKVTYFNKKIATDYLEFIIYDHSHVQVTGPLVESLRTIEHREVSPFILGQKILGIQLIKTLHLGDFIELNFDYTLNFNAFKIDFMNRFEPDYIELGLYTPWYPLTMNFEDCLYDLKFSVPDTHYVVGARPLTSGHWRLTQEKNPHCGIEFIIGLKEFQKIDPKESLLKIHWFSHEDEPMAEALYENVQEAVSFFTEKFGASGKEHLDMALVPRRNTASSGGYCRPNLIVIPMGENLHNSDRYSEDRHTYILEYMLHEVAHLWWSKADTQSFEDWLNESFAEYSKYMAIKALLGEGRHREIYRKLQLKAKTMPSLWDERISDEERFELMRVKGPVVLYALEKKLGETQMNQLLKEIHQNKLATTEEIFALVEKNYSPETATYFKTITF